MKKGEGFGKPLAGEVWFSKASREKFWVAAHPTKGRRTAPDNIKGKAKSPAGPTGRWEGHWEGGKTWSPQVGGEVFPNPHMLSTWGIPRGDITLWVWGEAKMPSCPQVGGGGTSEPVLSNDGFGGWENLEPTGRWGGRSKSLCTVDMGHTQMCLYHLDMRNLKMPSCPQVGGGALRNPYVPMTG